MSQECNTRSISQRMRDPKGSSPLRIMILCTQDPFRLPRMKSLANLCKRIGHTEVIGVTVKTDTATREYDGALFVERLYMDASYLLSSKIRIGLFVTYRFLKKILQKTRKKTSGQIKESSSLSQSLLSLALWRSVTEALYQRVRATSIIPRVVICCGFNALSVGSRMKKLYGCPIIYEDQGPYYTEEEGWGYFPNKFKGLIERKSLRFADIVITPSPQRTREFQDRYGIRRVFTFTGQAFVEKEYQRIIEYFCGREGQN